MATNVIGVTAVDSVNARYDDEAAMDALFAAIPNGERLRTELQDFRGRARFYYPATRSARYIRMDGVYVVCITITDVSSAEAEAIAEGCDEEDSWNPATFYDVAKRVLGAVRGH